MRSNKGFTTLEVNKGVNKFMKNNNKLLTGFTIIELIVVVAAISILASIVMVSVSGYINKSKDSAIKQHIDQFRKYSIMFATESSSGGFGSLCSNSDAEASKILNKFTLTNYCRSSQNRWVLCVHLNEGGAWCADSTGVSKKINSNDCKSSMQFCP